MHIYSPSSLQNINYQHGYVLLSGMFLFIKRVNAFNIKINTEQKFHKTSETTVLFAISYAQIHQFIIILF